MALFPNRPNISMTEELSVGEYGTVFAVGTNATPAPTGFVIFRIDFLAASVFTTLTSDASAPQAGDAVAATSFPAGFSLYGKFTTFTLASGKAVAYYKSLQT